jgi:hypothetical protein
MLQNQNKYDDIKLVGIGELAYPIESGNSKTYIIRFKQGKYAVEKIVNVIGLDINSRKQWTFFVKSASCNQTHDYLIKKAKDEQRGITPLMFAIKEKDILEVAYSEKLQKYEQETNANVGHALAMERIAKIDFNKVMLDN